MDTRSGKDSDRQLPRKETKTMASEYQKTQIVDRSAEEVFSWVSDVSNLPHYLPPVKKAWVEGPASAGKPGERVRMRVEIPDRYETEGEGYFHVDQGERRMEWGAEMGRDYSGWLSVSDRADGQSEVTVHLWFGEHSVEEHVQEESSEERDPLEESLSATLESIRRQLEEGSGKLEPPPTTH
jgi:Polyketide cyclase / dehydrase and lipid transport